jgi:hypothetical protein
MFYYEIYDALAGDGCFDTVSYDKHVHQSQDFILAIGQSSRLPTNGEVLVRAPLSTRLTPNHGS